MSSTLSIFLQDLERMGLLFLYLYILAQCLNIVIKAQYILLYD